MKSIWIPFINSTLNNSNRNKKKLTIFNTNVNRKYNNIKSVKILKISKEIISIKKSNKIE